MKSLIPWRSGPKNASPVRREDRFDRWWSDPFDSKPSILEPVQARLPSVDVSEDEKEVKVRAEIPGMSEKDLELSWHDGVLSIRGEKREEKEEKNKERYYRECRYGSFSRDIPVGRNVDWKKSSARYKNGVLAVTLPKTESARKSIEIKVQ